MAKPKRGGKHRHTMTRLQIAVVGKTPRPKKKFKADLPLWKFLRLAENMDRRPNRDD